MLHHNLGINGNLEIKIFDSNGRSHIPFNEAILEDPVRTIRVHNLVVTSGLNKIRDLIGYPEVNNSGWTPNYIAVGSNNATTTESMTTLGTEVFRKEFAAREALDPGSGIIFYGYIETSEANGNNIYEVGTFTEATGGLLWSRATHALIAKTDSIFIIYEWTWTITAS